MPDNAALAGMDLIDRIREIAARMRHRIAKCDTEEATKNALVMPVLQHVLGYEVFDPHQVMPEFTADVGTKKHEKVDYAILSDDQPMILIECKKHGTPQRTAWTTRLGDGWFVVTNLSRHLQRNLIRDACEANGIDSTTVEITFESETPSPGDDRAPAPTGTSTRSAAT